MRAWKAVLLVNLALAIGVGWGYAAWGRRVATVGAELAATRATTARLERELAASRASRGGTGEGAQRWDVNGVVRAILPEINLIVLTHDAIPGYMTPMTMGFRAASPSIYDRVRVGDAVRFTLEGTPPNVVITAIQKSG